MLASKAVDFIDDHMQTHPDSPFLMYYSSQAVHKPWTPSDSLAGRLVQGATGISNHGDMIHELDLQVGAIISKLESEGILDQTLIIFTSDNGGLNRAESQANGHYSNLGLRGAKASIYEGGHRVPFIVRWPCVVAPGSLSHQTILISDWVATMYDMLGIPMGSEDAMDAVSILPVLAGLQNENDPIRDHLIVQGGNPAKHNGPAIRNGDDILIYSGGIDYTGGIVTEFFNLASDPLQTNNLIADPVYQSRIIEMDAMYRAAVTNSRTSPALDYSDPNVRTPWEYATLTVSSDYGRASPGNVCTAGSGICQRK
jgi:arylsulfatase A-like enzyme